MRIKTKVTSPFQPWSILVVDDDPAVHQLTQFILSDFQFAKQPLNLITAYSAVEAQQILQQNNDIAVAIIDVVMETDDAGLKLVEYIRQELNQSLIRLIIRTGQAGLAPEKTVCEDYDIDNYIDKAELTANKFYNCLRTALRAYQTLMSLEKNRQSLQQALCDAQAGLRAKNAFLAEMHHELRTPLNAILGYCELIREDMQDNDYQHNDNELDNIQSSGKNLLSMISQLLKLTETTANQGQNHASHSQWQVSDVLQP